MWSVEIGWEVLMDEGATGFDKFVHGLFIYLFIYCVLLVELLLQRDLET